MVFKQFKKEHNLDSAQLDEVINKAFDELAEKYTQFNLSYDEDGVAILNFEDCTDEETGRWTKDQVENSLTEELLDIANSGMY